MKFVLPLFILMICTTCKPKQVIIQDQYYDIKLLFENQIKKLSAERPVFIKKIEINNSHELKEISSINWYKELAPFVQSDINKTAFLGSYNITITDSTINYSLKPNQKQTVKHINIIRDLHYTTFIEITSNDNNALYNWSKTLTASFKKGVLQSYTLISKQKILVFDEENIAIKSKRK